MVGVERPRDTASVALRSARSIMLDGSSPPPRGPPRRGRGPGRAGALHHRSSLLELIGDLAELVLALLELRGDRVQLVPLLALLLLQPLPLDRQLIELSLLRGDRVCRRRVAASADVRPTAAAAAAATTRAASGGGPGRAARIIARLLLPRALQ